MIRRPPRSTLFPTRRSSDLSWQDEGLKNRSYHACPFSISSICVESSSHCSSSAAISFSRALSSRPASAMAAGGCGVASWVSSLVRRVAMATKRALAAASWRLSGLVFSASWARRRACWRRCSAGLMLLAVSGPVLGAVADASWAAASRWRLASSSR